MRPKPVKTFEFLYCIAVALYSANAVRDYEMLKASAGEDLVRRGLDPDTLLVSSIILMIGLMLLLMVMVSRLRIGFVRYLIVALVAWEAWELYPIVMQNQGSSVMIGVGSAVLQAIAVAFTFLPDANRWFSPNQPPSGDL